MARSLYDLAFKNESKEPGGRNVPHLLHKHHSLVAKGRLTDRQASDVTVCTGSNEMTAETRSAVREDSHH